MKEAITFLKRFSDSVVVTLGNKGAVYTDSSSYHIVDGINVESKDFTGAGDMFLGAFMHKFKSPENAHESLIFANTCASKIIQTFGAKFERDSDYESLISGR